jgi:hypothetical protein
MKINIDAVILAILIFVLIVIFSNIDSCKFPYIF